MKIRTALVGVAAFASIAAAVPAAAAPLIQFNGRTGEFGNNTPASSFSDLYQFTTQAGRVTINLFSFAMNARTNVDFNGNLTTLNDRPLDEVSSGQLEFRQTLNQRVDAGVQNLVITGVAGTKGTYAGTISFAGVPEPAVWAFMILGFGAVGGGMRRREKMVVRPA